ncbi:MAG: carboxypeptidase-like regulatory domain-containing protein [Gemmatimonadota bacterium]
MCVGPPLEERIRSADGVFLGYALYQTQNSSSRRGTLLQTTFLIEKGWKGPAQDTVGVRSLLTGNCGARFTVGERYVVIAARDPYGLHQLDCYQAMRADLGEAALEVLGKPAWVAPHPGQREIDLGLIGAQDTKVHDQGDRIDLRGRVIDHDWHGVSGARIEMGSWGVVTSDSGGGFRIRGLRPGLYLARLTLPDGSVEEHYAIVRCGQLSRSECGSYRRHFIVEYHVPRIETPVMAKSNPVRSSSPLDSLQAVQLLRESLASLEVSEDLRDDKAFKRHMSGLFRAWGVEPPPWLRSTEEVIASLVDADRIGEAIALISIGDDRLERQRHLGMVFRSLSEDDEWVRALLLSDSLGHADLGVSQVLQASYDSPDWRSRAEAVERFIETLADTTDIEFMWYDLVDFVGQHDPQLAWTLADRRLSGADRIETRVDLLGLEYEGGPWPPDSLVLEAYAGINGLPEAKDRGRLLGSLRRLCERVDLESCGQLVFPPKDRPSPGSIADLVTASLAEGRFMEARAIGDTLRGLVSPERYALAVARGLWSAFRYGPCLLHEACAEAYRSETDSLLPILDQVAIDTRGPVTDSLNSRLAGLWAPVDPERAWKAIERIESQASRSDGLAMIAIATYDTDFDLAFAALLERGSAESTGIYLRDTYLDFKSRGDEDHARQILALVPAGTESMRMKLDWAERLKREDRTVEALRLALEALKDWDPEQMRGWKGQFGLFFRLGAVEELIGWARDLEDPDDRAAALAAIVGSVSRW